MFQPAGGLAAAITSALRRGGIARIIRDRRSHLHAPGNGCRDRRRRHIRPGPQPFPLSGRHSDDQRTQGRVGPQLHNRLKPLGDRSHEVHPRLGTRQGLTWIPRNRRCHGRPSRRPPRRRQHPPPLDHRRRRLRTQPPSPPFRRHRQRECVQLLPLRRCGLTPRSTRHLCRVDGNRTSADP